MRELVEKKRKEKKSTSSSDELGMDVSKQGKEVVVCDTEYFGIDPTTSKYGPVSPIAILFDK